MKPVAFLSTVAFLALTLALLGCATVTPGFPSVTVPNGSSPASANAPRAPMNDTEAIRNGWNHGNGILWVWRPQNSMFLIEDPIREGSSDEMTGYSRVKFGWWRGVRGTFTIEGRRLDSAAPPLRSSTPPASSYGDIGFIPSFLYFPTEGYWEITGDIDGKRLAFVVRVRIKD